MMTHRMLPMTRLLSENDLHDNPFAEWHPPVRPVPHAPDPKYLLELARSFSIERQSDLVLCTRFLPWMDLAVSAAEDGWRPLQSSAAELARRCREVVDLVEGSREALMARAEWCRAVMSFGLVRWWPVSLRDRAMASLGPFAVVIDCANPTEPWVHLDPPPAARSAR
jgi:hypothetical protein